MDIDPTNSISAYLAQYPVALHFNRLQHIARCVELACSHSANGTNNACLKQTHQRVVHALLQEVVSNGNIALYRDLVAMNFEKGCDVTMDNDAVKQMEASTSAELQQLQLVCGQAQHDVEATPAAAQQNTAARERYTRILVDLASAYAKRGDIQRSAKTIALARQESASLEPLQLMVLQGAIVIAFQTGTVFSAMGYLQRIEALIASSRAVPLGTAMKVSDGSYVFFVVADTLSELDRNNFSSVASLFKRLHRYPPLPPSVTLSPQAQTAYSQQSSTYLTELGKHVFNTQLTILRDLITIGVICLFATQPTTEATATLSQGFIKGWLEEDTLLNQFVIHLTECKYLVALKELELLVSQRLRYEVHLGPHVQTLYQMIRETTLQQYVKPYSTLSLTSMAVAFGVSVPELEQDLKRLIEAGKLQCRLDSVNHLLKERCTDVRTETANMVAAVGAKIAQETLMVARAVSLFRNDVILKATVAGRIKDAAGGLQHSLSATELMNQ